MKHLVFTIALLLITSTSSQATEEKLYSTKGYPYQLLLARADNVKIIYSENNHHINCKVKVSWSDKHILTTARKVTQQAFNEKPLANCLPRKSAKNILSMTFN